MVAIFIFDANHQYIVSDINKHFKLDSNRKLRRWLEIWTKFLDMVAKLQNRKDHSVSAIFPIY